ncbi:MAG: hypothetical protein Q7V63_02225 [Gammaproteobacteria bacterium]|nr:hypothetical protein [Gammaproteobacteria bacterium]
MPTFKSLAVAIASLLSPATGQAFSTLHRIPANGAAWTADFGGSIACQTAEVDDRNQFYTAANLTVTATNPITNMSITMAIPTNYLGGGIVGGYYNDFPLTSFSITDEAVYPNVRSRDVVIVCVRDGDENKPPVSNAYEGDCFDAPASDFTSIVPGACARVDFGLLCDAICDVSSDSPSFVAGHTFGTSVWAVGPAPRYSPAGAYVETGPVQASLALKNATQATISNIGNATVFLKGCSMMASESSAVADHA